MKRIIITGASDGLGKALAELCVSKKIEVINISRSKCDVKNVINIICDLTSEKQITNAVDCIKEKYSTFDALINCAGQISLQKPNNIDYKEMERVFKVNLFAPIFLTSQLFDLIKQNEADVVNVGSTVGFKAYEDQCVYGASKWGLRGVTLNLQTELKKSKCRVIGFNPGGMYSNFFGKYKGANTFDGDPLDWMLPSDVAKVLFNLLNTPKQVEVTEICVNRKGKRN